MTFDMFFVYFVLPMIILVCMLWWYSRPDQIGTYHPQERIRVMQDVVGYQCPRAMPVQCHTQEQEEDLHAIFFQKLDEYTESSKYTLHFQCNEIYVSNWQELPVTREDKIDQFEWLECRGIEQKIERRGQAYPPDDADLKYPEKIEYWFHGTDINSAKSIIEEGIGLEKGYNKQDFSHRNGFYVNPSFSGARMWACMKTEKNNSEPAVIVFKLEGGLGESGSILNVSDSYEIWETLIDHNRGGRKSFLNKNVKRNVLKHDCIYGPMYNRSSSHKLSGFDKPYRQLCIRKQTLADKFSRFSSIDGIIVYPAGSRIPKQQKGSRMPFFNDQTIND